MNEIEEIAHNLARHEQENWNLLVKQTIEIFKQQHKKEHEFLLHAQQTIKE